MHSNSLDFSSLLSPNLSECDACDEQRDVDDDDGEEDEGPEGRRGHGHEAQARPRGRRRAPHQQLRRRDPEQGRCHIK